MEYIVKMKDYLSGDDLVFHVVGTDNMSDAIAIALEHSSHPVATMFLEAFPVLAGEGESYLAKEENA